VKLFFIFLFGFFGFSSAHAEMEDTFSIGPALEVTGNNRVNNSAKGYGGKFYTQWLPTGYLKWGPVMINDKGLQLSIVQNTPFALYLVGNFQGFIYSTDTIPLKDTSIFAGGGIRIYPLSIYHMQDFERESQGAMTRVQLQYPISLENFFVLPTLGYDYYDENFAEYYFGVQTSQATTSMSPYSLVKGSDVFYNLRIFYTLNESWEIYFMAERRDFSREILNSPTTTTNSMQKTVLGVTYKLF